MAALAAWGVVAAAEPGRRGGRDDLDIVVPIDPREHERLYWFGRPDHHLVPGTVTINRAPYVCDPHRRSFRERDAFVAHLRTVHRLAADEIPGALVVEDGVVHFF
jgi:hypothetical protein